MVVVLSIFLLSFASLTVFFYFQSTFGFLLLIIIKYLVMIGKVSGWESTYLQRLAWFGYPRQMGADSECPSRRDGANTFKVPYSCASLWLGLPFVDGGVPSHPDSSGLGTSKIKEHPIQKIGPKFSTPETTVKVNPTVSWQGYIPWEERVQLKTGKPCREAGLLGTLNARSSTDPRHQGLRVLWRLPSHGLLPRRIDRWIPKGKRTRGL